MKAFNRFYRKLIVISVLYEIFRCSNVHFTPVQTQNVVHTICSAETSTAARNSQPFPRYGQKLIVISVLFEIFRRLNLHFIPFQTQNVVHTICSAETSPAPRNSPTFTRFLRKLVVISVLYEILRRLNVHFCSILDAERSARGFQPRIKPSDPKFATISSILTKINLCIDIFCDISTFKRTFNSILHVECSAHYMQCGNKPSGSQI